MRFEQNPTGFEDWGGLHKLLVECFAYMFGIIDPPSSLHKLTPDDLAKKAKSETLILVWDDKTLIGAAYFAIRDEVIYIGKIAVAKSHRGQNIAKRIIGLAVELALQNDKKWLELETRIELIYNQQAFGKMGFIAFAEHSHVGFDRPTWVTMRREVNLDL